MTAISTPDRPRSRRALLAGALGGIGAWAASAIGKASPAQAGAGDPIRMGRLNKAAGTETILQTNSNELNSGLAGFVVKQRSDAPAIRAEANFGPAVEAIAGFDGTGVSAYSPDWYGVHGRSLEGVGVVGESTEYVGIVGNSTHSVGVSGHSLNDIGVLGSSANSYAGVFDGPVLMATYQDMVTQSGDPPAPTRDDAHPFERARLFARDNGSGKTQLCVRFPTGAVQVLATEP